MALQTPLWLGKKEYKASEDRMMVGLHRAEGVLTPTALQILQRQAGANWSIDVQLGWGFVDGDNQPTSQGQYAFYNDARYNVPLTVTQPVGNPRVDIVVARVRDSEAVPLAEDDVIVEVIPGTPTAGANATNRSGAAAIPSTALWLADLVINPADGSVQTSNITDRRNLAGPKLYDSSGNAHALTVDAAGNLQTRNISGTTQVRQGVPTGVMEIMTTNTVPGGYLLANGQQVLNTDPTHATLRAMYVTAGNPHGTAGGNPLVPNMLGRFPVGRDAGQTEFDVLGETGGLKTVQLSATHLATHVHSPGTLMLGDDSPSHSHNASYNLGTQSVEGSPGPVNAAPERSASAATDGLFGPIAVTTGGPTVNHSHGWHPTTPGTTGDGSAGGLGGGVASAIGTAHQNLPPYLALNFIVKL